MTPSDPSTGTDLMPITPGGEGSTGHFNALPMAKAERRAADLKRQREQTIEVDGYRIMPAIGRTGGADNVGWELHPLVGHGSVWFVATKVQAIAAISRHRERLKG